MSEDYGYNDHGTVKTCVKCGKEFRQDVVLLPALCTECSEPKEKEEVKDET